MASHPCLRDRLKAMGVSTKQAIHLITQKQESPPARTLFPNWKKLEKRLTANLMDVYRDEYLAKREMAQIIMGRPR
jgi:hypothetical protein